MCVFSLVDILHLVSASKFYLSCIHVYWACVEWKFSLLLRILNLSEETLLPIIKFIRIILS